MNFSNLEEEVAKILRKIVEMPWKICFGKNVEARWRETTVKKTLKNRRECVTKFDLKINEILVEEIRRNFDFNIESEEEIMLGERKIERKHEFSIIIDPIDGTTNFAGGNPHFATAMVVVDADRRPVVGVVHHPVSGETFWSAGRGAFCDETPIRVNETGLEGLVLISDGESDPEGGKQLISSCREAGWRIEVRGSAQLDFCAVARGEAVGYLKTLAPDWDCLAGMWIVKNAGGRVFRSADGNVVASGRGAGVFEKLKEKITEMQLRDL